ncbi:hypothetical protein CWI84_11170 [Idiomarina tyrosinivorans]|uniref:NADH:ubiquinone oxidoreductase intermediate-associated protein 30 domain-containing protein n=1 Tax=Idiomarina tyrosinivorans TaxID=1445662 RepID=A0A432ZG63_9GAMM|nr:CIA30 family protein [Idiomarina tyrosinivorans]RUO76909.1 hypothetical protein CWI84_11170 [Idiomarina tyrosinivorans]
MKLFKKEALYAVKVALLSGVLGFSQLSVAAAETLVDRFNDSKLNDFGFTRQLMTDAIAGGETTAVMAVIDGTLQVRGDIRPARGQLGWASVVIPLADFGKNWNASDYQGIRLRIKLNSGNLSVSANSTAITNFDYHAAAVAVAADQQFHQVDIPFSQMQRAWSSNTPLAKDTLNSISIAAYALQAATFDYQVDSVSFY